MKVRLKAEALVHGGEVLARHEGRVVFLRGAAPGDTVEAELTGEGRFERARALRILERGGARVDPPCAIVDRCGGCPVQHIAYPSQLAAKQELSADALERIGGAEHPEFEGSEAIESWAQSRPSGRVPPGTTVREHKPGAPVNVSAGSVRHARRIGFEYFAGLRSAVAMRSEIGVLYETPAQHLIQDEDGRVIGVEVSSPGGRVVRLRALRGVVLTTGGIRPALNTLARRSPVPVELAVHVDRRLPERVEVATYYVVSEALANAAKHAHASVVQVDVDPRDAGVELVVRDDGVGGADTRRGSGLIGLRDRVEALGGTLEISSSAGKGTSLLARIPIERGEMPRR